MYKQKVKEVQVHIRNSHYLQSNRSTPKSGKPIAVQHGLHFVVQRLLNRHWNDERRA